MMHQALYYPWIDITSEAWLKTSLLYWDSVRTIVPEAIEAPYSTATGTALEDEGFLVPLRVHSDMEEIRELAAEAIEYLDTNLAGELIVHRRGRRREIHVHKLSRDISRLRIHHDKFGHDVLRFVSRQARTDRTDADWLEVDEGFASFYMTLLANRLADRIGAALLTSIPTAERLAIAARLDAQLNGVITWGLEGRRRRWREYEAFGPRRPMPRTLASGLLAQLAIERLAIDPDTPIKRLLEFRDQHRDELALFRTKVEQLARAVDDDLPIEALRQRVSDLHAHDVVPALENLKRALDSRRIRWLGDGLLKVAFMSAGSSSMLVAAGLAVPTALLAGVGVSLVVSGAMYNVDKAESLRSNPYTYLLAMERELGAG